jgi:hypothetical protein
VERERNDRVGSWVTFGPLGFWSHGWRRHGSPHPWRFMLKRGRRIDCSQSEQSVGAHQNEQAHQIEPSLRIKSRLPHGTGSRGTFTSWAQGPCVRGPLWALGGPMVVGLCLFRTDQILLGPGAHLRGAPFWDLWGTMAVGPYVFGANQIKTHCVRRHFGSSDATASD